MKYIIMFLLVNVTVIASDPARFDSLVFPMTTIKQMKKLNLAPITLSRIIQNGTRIKSCNGYKCVYVCNVTEIGVVVDESTGNVINIVQKICAYEFQKQKDAAEKRKRIRK